MSGVPLRAGPLKVPGYKVGRSGLRWLVEDGRPCRPGDLLAYCNIGLTAEEPVPGVLPPFEEEGRDFQVAFAATRSGRLRKAAEISRGGFLDQLHFYERWDDDFSIGTLETRPGEQAWGSATGEMRLLFLTGRRTADIAEVRAGLLTGWHDRCRAWWGDANETAPGTLLSLGICEQEGVIRGEAHSFFELFSAVPGAAQAIAISDDTLVPCARVVIEQLRRTDDERRAIAIDIAQSLSSGEYTPTPADWLFAGSLLNALQRSPMSERPDVLTRAGILPGRPPDAVLLSLNSEAPFVMRHKRLGYTMFAQNFRLGQAGPAVREWIRADFEAVTRTAGDIKADLIELIDAAAPGTHFLILNGMSSSAQEDIYNYAPFDAPMSGTLATVRNKELNLMLCDLTRERDVSIVDADAMAAELGGSANLPDGVHQSGLMQATQRNEVLRILKQRGVPGFTSAKTT